MQCLSKIEQEKISVLLLPFSLNVHGDECTRRQKTSVHTRGRKHILDCKMRNKTFPTVYIRIEDIASSVQRQMVTLIPVHRRQQLTFYTSVQRNKSQFPPLQMTGLGIRSFALR